MLNRKTIILAVISILVVGLLGTSLSVAATSHEDELSGELEIFSWWAGDEGPALQALIDLYEEKYPDVEVINATVTGGSGVNAKAVLKTRMLGGNPPDSFQVHAGQELIGTWVTADRMEDLTFLFKEEGWMDAFPDELIDLISTEEGIWSVPITIHRSNVMWYIPDNLDEWGIEVPNSWDEFLEIAPELEENGVTPLALGQNWTVNHLWESVALDVLGPDKWEALWEGELAFNSEEGVAVWEKLDEIMEYVNDDYSSLSWQQATDLVVEGDAAFNVMGDWAAGYMDTTLELEPKEGFGWAASPGTEGEFMLLSDSFGLPKGAPNRENTIAFLKLLGSKEGSDTFNPLKGSISPRLDSDLSKYSVYSQSAAEDFSSDRLVGSLAHGAVANEGFMNAFADVMEIFLDSRDPERAANAAQAIAKQNGIQ
ncbi:carbohydrate ABC transporter substrate-binding protein [Candidatus Bipolaricaulota bacterium]|nr:carbohydrate ABC transporter substrate-binding protein [Candidatus Bipolaricaulota bacterium]